MHTGYQAGDHSQANTGLWFVIASFGNSTLASRVKFPQLAIIACGNPTYWTGGARLGRVAAASPE